MLSNNNDSDQSEQGYHMVLYGKWMCPYRAHVLLRSLAIAAITLGFVGCGGGDGTSESGGAAGGTATVGPAAGGSGGGSGSSGGGESTYTVGGSIAGLTSSGLILANAGGTVSPATNAASFAFSTTLKSGTPYSVTVQVQPTGQNCAVANGSGTIASANVTTVQINCVSIFSLGGSISGLTATGLVLSNGGDTVSPAANDTLFTFPIKVAHNSAYEVGIKAHPTGQDCRVSNSAGVMSNAAVVNVTVTCAPSQWVWVGGSSTAGVLGALDTPSTPATANLPGGRFGASYWTDVSGNFWLFGGYGPFQQRSVDSGGTLFATTTGGSYASDLWRYNKATGTWSWIDGFLPALANLCFAWVTPPRSPTLPRTLPLVPRPSPRGGSTSWADGAGNLWLFGGHDLLVCNGSVGSRNNSELWKFSPESERWTLVSDSRGFPPSSRPIARYDAVSWTDGAGNFWIFGGVGCDAVCASASTTGGTPIVGPLNDLWKFNPNTGEWAWVSGSNLSFAGGVYGVQGIAASGNAPGARYSSATWTDSAGNLWLFGGLSSTADSSGTVTTHRFNDLWMFNPSTGLWTWKGGLNAADGQGVYGALGVADIANIPSARGGAATWTDSAGNFWLFGGDTTAWSGSAFGFSLSFTETITDHLNDLWRFTPSTGQWTWVGGSNTPASRGEFGAQGVAAAANVPSARGSAAAFTDSSGSLWLFGGHGYDAAGDLEVDSLVGLSDMWKFGP